MRAIKLNKKTRKYVVRSLSLLVLIGGLLVALSVIRSPMFRGLFAASYTAQFSFEPTSSQLYTNGNLPVNIYLDPSGAQLAFARVLISFDPNQVQLASEVDVPTSALAQLIKKTPATEANSSGILEIVLGLKPENRNTPMNTKAKIATLNLTTKTTAKNVNAVLDFLKPEMQVVDISEVATQIGSTQASILVNPSATPSPTATPTITPPPPTATPRPTLAPTPTPSPTPRPTATPTIAPTPTATPKATVTPVPTIAPTPTPTPSENGLSGTYYNNKNLTSQILTRVDNNINFYWGRSAPDPKIGADTFSVSWTGKVKTGNAGSYTFYTRSDDGVRLWVNDNLVINDWKDHGLKERSATVSLPANSLVNLKMEYYENGGIAEVYLLWTQPGGTKVLIPSTSLFR